jgi:hypothetical protein
VLKLLGILTLAGCLGGAAGGTLLAKTLRVEDAAAGATQVGIEFGTLNRLTVGGTGLAAGDRLQRAFDLKKMGKAPISALTLTTAAATSSALDTDPVNGLQLQIDKCPDKWKEHKKPYSYTCKKAIVPVVTARPVIGSGIPLDNIPELTSGKKKVHLLLTLTLPATAPAELENLSSALSYTFTAA